MSFKIKIGKFKDNVQPWASLLLMVGRKQTQNTELTTGMLFKMSEKHHSHLTVNSGPELIPIPVQNFPKVILFLNKMTPQN